MNVIPLAFTGALAAFMLLPRVQQEPRLLWSFAAAAQGSVLLYWGWYWRPVYDYAYLIAAQLLFAYAFDMLLVWSRRDRYTPGFGPFPVIFSINLFLWFREGWPGTCGGTTISESR